MKPPHSLSEVQLRAYSEEHIAYEIEMLRWTASVLYGWNQAALQGADFESRESRIFWTTYNAYLESFAMHSRNLIDFLYLRNFYRKDRANDIVVEDYIDSTILTHHLPPITGTLKNTKMKTDKQIAHLAEERPAYDTPWFYSETFRNIMNAFHQIAPLFPEAKTSDRFRTIISPPQPPLVAIRWSTLVAQEEGQPIGLSITPESS